MKLEEMSKSNRILIAVLLPLVVIALFTSLYFLNALDDIKKLQNEEKALKEEIEKAQKLASRYEELKALNEQLKRKMEILTQLLPKESEISGVLKKVSEIGLQRGLTVTLWRPQNKNVHPSNEIYEIPVEVGIKGKYHVFGNFFSDISGIERVVNLKKIDLKKGEREPTLLNVHLIAVTYSIIPEEEKQKLKAQKQPQKKDQK